MSQSAAIFYLKVKRVENSCLFELSWGKRGEQQLEETVPYPETLDRLYQEWRTSYLHFYGTQLRGKSATATAIAPDSTELRGRVAASGNIAPPPIDWRARLVQSEAKLLDEFHQWLSQGKLLKIRSRIAQGVKEAIQNEEGKEKKNAPVVEIFLTCSPLDIARLPWETWEIGAEFATEGKIRFARTPPNREGFAVPPQNCSRKARILAILGDDTGLNFQGEKEALQKLKPIADIHFVGWQPGKDIGELKTEIVDAIIDERGWDILFFAGHSDEMELVGGELAIAPGASLFLSEIEHALLAAKDRGLQFALFNSCNGLSFANALIDLGLSQVVVMRERIHNRVAQEFFLRFLQSLAEYSDVHEALLMAGEYLQLKKHLTYPGAYLVPSLFRYPDTPLFCLKPFGWKEKVKRWLPTKREAIALASLAFLSWQPQVQQALIEQRVLTQAKYRHVTQQLPTATKPPVLIVQIDEESIRRAKMPFPAVPMHRSYLAQVVDKLTAANARVIGIDYILDRPFPEPTQDQQFAQSLRAATQQGTWFVFAAVRKHSSWLGIMPELAHPNWSLQGDVRVFFEEQISYITPVPRKLSDDRRLPFSYLLALAHQLNSKPSKHLPQPQLQSSVPWISQLKAYVNDTTGSDYKELFSPSSRLQPLTNFSYPYRQMWLHPIIDFSIPPDRVYQGIPAWKLLEKDALKLDPDQQPVVMIASGGYTEAGVTGRGEDNFPLPAAMAYWHSQENLPDPPQMLPGGEAHAYLVHHFLNQRFVVPIPDLWMVGVAALLGKAAVLALEGANHEQRQKKRTPILCLLHCGRNKWILAMGGGTLIYGLASLQFYITSAVLLPYLLPVATFWTYVFLNLSKRKYDV
jgi:hypothetical protein